MPTIVLVPKMSIFITLQTDNVWLRCNLFQPSVPRRSYSITSFCLLLDIQRPLAVTWRPLEVKTSWRGEGVAKATFTTPIAFEQVCVATHSHSFISATCGIYRFYNISKSFQISQRCLVTDKGEISSGECTVYLVRSFRSGRTDD